ncbi:MAG TPA: hypothetical protein VGL83_05985 [Stellaceae bacterium]
MAVGLSGSARGAAADGAVVLPGPSTFSADHLHAMASGLRQSLGDNGLAAALSRAGDWVKELELHWAAHRNGKASPGLETDTGATALAAAAATPTAPGFVARGHRFDLGLVSVGTGGAESQVWTLGHAQPLAALTPASGTSNSASHDVELGLRMPALPWNAALAGDHYWWGERGLGPQVEGSRVGLKFRPVANLEIEGGHAEDTRGSGGFVGVLYRFALDQP